MLEGEGTEGFDGVFDELYTIPELREFAEKRTINLQGRDKKADIIASVREWAGSSDESEGTEDTDVDGSATSDDTEEDSNDESDDVSELGDDSASELEEHPYVKLVENYYGGKLVKFDEREDGAIVFEVEGTEHKGTLLELYENMIAEPVAVEDLPEEDVRLIVSAIVKDLSELQTSISQAVRSLSRELDEVKADVKELKKSLEVQTERRYASWEY